VLLKSNLLFVMILFYIHYNSLICRYNVLEKQIKNKHSWGTYGDLNWQYNICTIYMDSEHYI